MSGDYRSSVAAAFKPFADFMAGGTFDKLPAEFHITAGSHLARRQVTVNDLRNLAAAIASEPPEPMHPAVAALRSLAIIPTMAPGVQQVVHNGHRCRVCATSWRTGQPEHHMDWCALKGTER